MLKQILEKRSCSIHCNS